MATVLLIEPDRLLANNYARALERGGHQVVWRSSGQSAVHAADEVRPEVVLLELQMQGHNGLEFLYEFRSYPEWGDIPVILLTMVPDLALDFDPSTMDQLGVTGYLYKPQTKLSHVVKAVQRATDHHNLRVGL